MINTIKSKRAIDEKVMGRRGMPRMGGNEGGNEYT